MWGKRGERKRKNPRRTHSTRVSLYPEDYLFSNQFMEDLGRIYSLRKYFPSFDDTEKTEGTKQSAD